VDHANLARLLPCADVTVATAVFPEAFGMVAAEALSSGVMPVQTHHTSFIDVINVVNQHFRYSFQGLKELGLDDSLVSNLANNITVFLYYFPEMSDDERQSIRKQCNRLAQENFSLASIAGELEDILDEDKRRLYCLDNVHVMGHQLFETLVKFHSRASLSVLPSRSEGFGIAALEAMGCGTPLVVTRTGGPDKFAVGKVVEKENPEQLANAILNIISLPHDEHRALCRGAYRKAHQFSWKSIVE